MNKKTFLVYLFFILIYGNQGLSGLPGQSIYYLTRETWGMSVTSLGWLGFITGIGWVIKPLWGFIIDRYPLPAFYIKLRKLS